MGDMEKKFTSKEKLIIDRIEQFCGWRNLNTASFVVPSRRKTTLCGQLWNPVDRGAIEKLEVFSTQDRIPFETAKEGTFQPTKVGESFGPVWSTHWFRVAIKIPQYMEGKEVHLIWNSNSEALAWTEDGTPLQGLVGGRGNMRRIDMPLTMKAKSGETRTVYIEMACNGLFGNGAGGTEEPPDVNRRFVLEEAALAIFHRRIWDVLCDLTIVKDMAIHLPKGSAWRERALHIANSVINEFQFEKPQTIDKCQEILEKFLKQKNGEGQCKVIAVGHCHIDTAWLWPYGETIRKCLRSWATQIRNMEAFPSYKFACSQAQQYEWIQQKYPILWKQIVQRVKEGRFLPVGGTWVEMDANLPNGESFARQFLLGQNFFQKAFGVKSKVFWLPDTFGYSAQLPQILRNCGMSYFVTQKMSWNRYNKFPYSTFVWEGLDGHSVLAHFPPADTYNSIGTVEEVVFSSTNNQELGIFNESLMLFGHGDGGGGPNPAILESLSRMKDVAGVPHVELDTTPEQFFQEMEKYEKELPHWIGELYLEDHRGTLTSQAAIKLANRRCERLLFEVEALYSILFAWLKVPYPYEKLIQLWKYVLLNQFHDVLPGSSIGDVYKDANLYYQKVKEEGIELLKAGLKEFNSLKSNGLESNGSVVGSGIAFGSKISEIGMVNEATSTQPSRFEGVHVEETEGRIKISNNKLEAWFGLDGRLYHLSRKDMDREFISADSRGGNSLVIYEDVPTAFDAWNVEAYADEKPIVFAHAEKHSVIERGPKEAKIRFTYRLGDSSTMKQDVILKSNAEMIVFDCECDWHESFKILRVEFPVTVHSDKVFYETQFGYLTRPNHRNTSWDAAKFEVCGHRFCDISEPDCGVALLNDCKYGYSAKSNTLRLSLLRSPKSPDDHCDMGQHVFRYAVFPHKPAFPCKQVLDAAYELNTEASKNDGWLVNESVSMRNSSNQPFLKVVTEDEKDGIVLSCLKKAENKDSIIYGFMNRSEDTASIQFHPQLPFRDARLTNLLEEDFGSSSTMAHLPFTGHEKYRAISFGVKPFQVVTIELIL
eukprot:jgi/Galph1/2562/GphlegSOOS_G1192.1